MRRSQSKENIGEIFDNVRKTRPLTHHITNCVTVNDCANIVLAVGASPVMADEIDEINEIVSISSALVINIGMLNKRTIETMFAAGKKANEIGIPVVLDPVGAGASTLRTETAKELIREIKFAVIRGNLSEIKTISEGRGNTRGVDAAEGDSINDQTVRAVSELATGLALSTSSVVAITGVTDVISDGKVCFYIKNGHAMMSSVTGTGCMCTSLIGAFCGASKDYTTATVAAITAMGLAGEKAYERTQKIGAGSGTFRTCLIDEINLMTGSDLLNGGKMSFEKCI